MDRPHVTFSVFGTGARGSRTTNTSALRTISAEGARCPSPNRGMSPASGGTYVGARPLLLDPPGRGWLPSPRGPISRRRRPPKRVIPGTRVRALGCEARSPGGSWGIRTSADDRTPSAFLCGGRFVVSGDQVSAVPPLAGRDGDVQRFDPGRQARTDKPGNSTGATNPRRGHLRATQQPRRSRKASSDDHDGNNPHSEHHDDPHDDPHSEQGRLAPHASTGRRALRGLLVWPGPRTPAARLLPPLRHRAAAALSWRR